MGDVGVTAVPESDPGPGRVQDARRGSVTDKSLPAPRAATPPPLGAPSSSRPSTLSPALLLSLQRSAGNGAVTKLIRASEVPLSRQSKELRFTEPARSIKNAPVAAVQRNIEVQRDIPAPTPAQQIFLNKCGEATTAVVAANATFDAWLSGMGMAYGDAWKAHNDAITQAKKKAQLPAEIVLGAILAFVPGGVGGAIGFTMQKLSKQSVGGAFIVDGLKDLTKWGFRTVPNWVPAEHGPMPVDPLQWQNGMNEIVKIEIAYATNGLLSWQHAVNSNDPNFDSSFDPVAAMKASLTVSSIFVPNLKLDQEAVRKGFQQGFIDEWITNVWGSPRPPDAYDAKIASGIDKYGNGIGMPGLGNRMISAPPPTSFGLF